MLTAGLTWARNDMMIPATVPPKDNPIRTSANVALSCGNKEAIMTVPGPIRTSKYVPRSSERHCALHSVHGSDFSG